jgi:hypothetical protein
MATNIKPTKKNSPAIKTGRARDNKQAVDYAPPHTMKGKKITGNEPMERGVYATHKSADKSELKDPVPNGPSYANTKEPKTSGIEMRGAGAATKGRMSRGPMA